jgi:hypothetical protein
MPKQFGLDTPVQQSFKGLSVEKGAFFAFSTTYDPFIQFDQGIEEDLGAFCLWVGHGRFVEEGSIVSYSRIQTDDQFIRYRYG